jgi:hypothetical protein
MFKNGKDTSLSLFKQLSNCYYVRREKYYRSVHTQFLN